MNITSHLADERHKSFHAKTSMSLKLYSEIALFGASFLNNRNTKVGQHDFVTVKCRST